MNSYVIISMHMHAGRMPTMTTLPSPFQRHPGCVHGSVVLFSSLSNALSRKDYDEEMYIIIIITISLIHFQSVHVPLPRYNLLCSGDM